MIFLFKFFLFINFQSEASIDFGVGSSSFTGGRGVPTLAIGADDGNWGGVFRSVGVQTPIYAQNAWTIAAYKTAYSETLGPIESIIGVGAGATYVLRTFRNSPSDPIETSREYVLGPHLSLKFEYGPVYLGFDTFMFWWNKCGCGNFRGPFSGKI